MKASGRRPSMEERILKVVRANEPISCADLKRRLGMSARGDERMPVIGRACWSGLSYQFGEALFNLIVRTKQIWVHAPYPCKLSIRRPGQ
jgi:hypothetical protein